jgi:nucleoside-diphosphate-sugar epimerase
MRIFITGATGVIGRRLVPLLRGSGHEVTAAARSLDLFDGRTVLHAIDGHDTVVNLATHIPAPSRMILPWAWRQNDRLRRVASATLVEASIAAGVSRFVQESFAPIYENYGDSWIDERMPRRPVSYNRTVIDAEESAGRFSRSGGAGVVLRFGSFYGPDALQTSELITQVRKGWALLPGPPSSYISSLSHDDAASAVAAALALPAGVYNAVDDEPVTHRVFVDSLAAALGVASPKLPPAWLTPVFGSLGEMLSRSLRVSNRKLRSASGWAPQNASVREAWAMVVRGDRPSTAEQRIGLGADHGVTAGNKSSTA